MTQKTEPLSPNFDDILHLVKQLPREDKIRLSKELEKDTIKTQLTQLLEAFQTDELSLETISEEVEAIRADIYAKQENA
ncbi:hypothetical protein VB715_20960 [Crocosphaera sp. UHCC 0190]|uniref:type II toxin-antitoxin system VapB15 family antitoxin n=1 Tax=Crocosphaera sp. UHCC 0190 TaxID=3110246 RepID=UPI002B2145EC|nr:hypothetical protein [Crocosphaera sp. UHCC 0190]MEA5512246.1 hypothetical protein [Crocosphaera sp. UHCC 0190]